VRASVQRLLKNTTPDGEMDAFEPATYTLTVSDVVRSLTLILNLVKQTQKTALCEIATGRRR